MRNTYEELFPRSGSTCLSPLPLYPELYKVLLLEFYKMVGGKFTEASRGWIFPLRLQEMSESSR